MSKVCDDKTLTYIQTRFAEPQASKVQSIQTLWSGYGEIARYYLPSSKQSVIAKLVRPPANIEHPRGWNGQQSHARKLDSYVNESRFYQHFSQRLDRFCRTPLCYFSSTEETVVAKGEDHAVKDIQQDNIVSLLLMEDLDQAGFAKRYDEGSLESVRLGIRWLAYFHAKFLNQALHMLWPIGTYWHLATRPDEFAQMPEGELKQKATQLDSALNNARFQTLLHGDAKLANFCFSDDGSDLAAVDFQYVGRGAGIKDVMYFMGSCLDDAELTELADDLLDEYFVILKRAVERYHKGTFVSLGFAALEYEWRDLVPFAWADFQRFLAGWAPEHYKLNGYMQKQTAIALAKIW